MTIQRYNLALRNSLLLQYAAMKPKYRKRCYILAYFSQTPTSILSLTVSLESYWNADSNDTLSECIYCQLFLLELNTFLCKKYAIEPVGCKKPQTSPSLWTPGPPSHKCLSWPHSQPKTTAQSVHATKSPLVTVGRPKFTLKTAPFPLTITTPSNIPIFRPTQSPPQMAYRSSHLFCHSIHRPTNRWNRWQLDERLRLLYWYRATR